MKRMTYFVMALALVLGLAQCKKEQPVEPTSEGNGVHITLNVNGGASTGSANKGTRVNVDPNGNPMVTFEQGDTIEVASNGLHVGTLIHDGAKFIGDIENATTGQPLYFYFFGNKTPQFFGEGKSNCSVYIGEQTKALPVISFSASTEDFQTDRTDYSAIMQNKCSLMKFNVTTTSDTTIYIKGMNNFVTVNFGSGNNGFSYRQEYEGKIEMNGVNTENETWAIVLPQGPVAEGNAWTEDGYIGTRPAIGVIEANKYYSAGVDMTLLPNAPLTIPLTFEAITAGATVSLNRAGTAASSAPEVSLEISTDGISWTTYKVDSTITLTNVGDKVMFRGTNARYATGTSAYHNFSLGGDCYVYGNIMSLINATDYATLGSLDSNAEYIFESLFHGCTGLHTHSVKTLDLPATDLAPYCYSHMFKGCGYLTVAPELPADDFLKVGCYQGMFESCDALLVAVLPAKSLVQGCYASMFSGCSSLSRVTCLADSGISQGANTSGWMSDVANEGTFIRAANVNWPRDNNGIPTNWRYE